MARKKSTLAKEPVRLRMRDMSDGGKSLYLDIYKDGKRSYEYLKMYIIPEKTLQDKEQNEITLKAANAIKSQRVIEISKGIAGIEEKKEKPKVLLMDWMQTYLNNQIKREKKDDRQIMVAIKILKEYTRKDITLDDIDRDFCQGYIDYLMTEYKPRGKKLSNNTLHNYYRVVNGAFNAAVREDLMKMNPFTKIGSSDKIRKPESRREFMTIDEIKALIETPMSNNMVKSAYLFSCFCGLRMSDIKALKWKNVYKDGEQTRLEVVMQKTKAPIYLPLSNEALRWMPEKENKSPEDLVFDLPTPTAINVSLKPWAKKAGINKLMTFHTARHTFATLMLTLGADILTTSKLMGHTDVRMTQVYAKIINRKKDEAVNLVNGLFD